MKWYKVFASRAEAEAAVPLNGARRLAAGGQKICLAHTPEGFFAVADACPHRGASLSRGRINYLGEVVCPLHSYRYHLGTGQESNLRTRDVRRFALEWRTENSEEPSLFVAIG